MFTAGNPVLSTPNGRAVDEAEELDFMISLDPALNETTRHADVILPPTSPLEHDNYDFAFHNLAIRNTARYTLRSSTSPKVRFTTGRFSQREIDWQTDRPRAMPRVPPHKVVDAALQTGPYGRDSSGI